MEDYPRNSLMDPQTPKKKVEPEKPKLEKVVEGKVIQKKPSKGKKFFRALFAEETGDIKEYVIMDVLMPAIRDTIVDILQKSTEMLFYGKTKATSVRRPGGGTYVSYNNISNNRTRESGRRKAFDFDDIILESRQDAEQVLDTLSEIAEKYGQVTVADFYDTVGVTGTGYTDNQFGWIDLRSARVEHVRGGFMIVMPRVVELR